MGVPLQCSAFLVRKRVRAHTLTLNVLSASNRFVLMSSDSGPSHLQGLLKECNGLGADYLFQQDKPYDVSYDTGDKSIQCGRHVDAFKLWLMWKAKVQRKGSLPYMLASMHTSFKLKT